MAEKVVSVRLQARVEGFTAGMRKAKSSVEDVTKSAPTAQKGFDSLARGAAVAGAAIGVGLGIAVKRFAEFDKAMSAVRANTGATGAELESLRQAAIQLGADSQFSAKEAAEGINELAKAGIATADILQGGLRGSLDLAAAGQISVAEAAETTAVALTQFNLAGEESAHVADLLTAGANKALGSVGDLGAAMKQAGLVAASTGLTIEETTAGLAAFASAGLIGSDAGTSLKTMLQRLSAPLGPAAEAMETLGINAYDTQGQFVGLAEVAGQLQLAMGDMTPAARNAALATIFGSDAVRAANVLYAEGEQGIRDWTTAVDDQGIAAEQAAILTDNLSGDLERFRGAIDSALIQGGSGANEGLRSLVQGLTGLVNKLGEIPGPVLLITGALTGLALVIPKGISTFRAFTGSLDSVGLSMEKIADRGPRAAKGVNLVAAAAKTAAGAFTALQVAGALSRIGDESDALGIQTLTRSLVGTGDVVKTLDVLLADLQATSSEMTNEDLTSFGDALRYTFDPGFFSSIDNSIQSFGAAMTGIEDTSAITRASERLAELDTVLAGLVSEGRGNDAARIFFQLSEAAAAQGVSVDELKGKLPGYTEALAGVDNAAQAATGGTAELTTATDTAEEAAEKATEAWDKLKSAIEGLGSPLAQQRAAERDFQAAIDAASASIDENGKTLDRNTEKGRANEQSLDAIRQATLDKVLADYEATGSTESATAAMQKGRDAFIAAAIEAGKTETQAKALADQLGLVPKDVTILVSQAGAEGAGEAIDYAARDRYTTIWLARKDARSTDLASTGGLTGGRATGGPIYGPGTGTSDTAGLFRLSHGEHVWTAKEVAAAGGQGAVYALRKAVLAGNFPGLATGGQPQQYAPRVQVVTVPGTMSPPSITETNNAPVYIDKVMGLTLSEVEREASMRRRRDALSPSRRG